MGENRINIFLDSNVYIEECYNFQKNGNLYFLKEMAHSEYVSLYSNDIVVNEVEKHIVDEITKATAIIKKIPKSKISKGSKTVKHALAVIEHLEEYKKITELSKQMKDLSTSMKKDGVEQFKKYLEDTQTKILSNDSVSLQSVLDDYFGNELPFEMKEDKKSEFPDAIMVKSIVNFLKEEKLIYVVTNDKGFQKALKNQCEYKVTIFSKIKEMLNEVNRIIYGDDFEEYVQKRLKSQVSHIKGLVEKHIEDQEFEVDGQDIDRQGVVTGYDYEEVLLTNIEDIEIGDIYIESIAENSEEVVATVDCYAKLQIEGTFFDEENSVWDSENKEYMYSNYRSTFENHYAPFECRIYASIDNSSVIKDIVVDNVDIYLRLDQYTRINRKEIDELEKLGDMMMDGEADMLDSLEEYYKH